MRDETKVFLVDDDAGIRKGLGAALSSAGLRVEAFASAEEFLTSYDGDAPGCLLLDLRLDGMSGMQLLEQLRHMGGLLPVIVISGHGDIRSAVESMKLGAVEFLQKPLDHQLLLKTIAAALDQVHRRRESMFRTENAKDRLASLTAREREILDMLIEGKSSKQIANATGLSVRTVNNHRTHLLAKTGAGNTAHLVRLAMIARADQT